MLAPKYLLACVLLCASAACSSDPAAPTPGDEQDLTGAPTTLPTASLTPGVVGSVTDLRTLCTPNFSSTVRNVTSAEKAQVAAAYHFTGANSTVEYDHLISLEIGGSNDPKNLWPQPIAEAHVKDRLENLLHREVCAGKMQLPDVQQRIAADWIKLWNDVGKP